MSNAKKCDRCGVYYDPYDRLILVRRSNWVSQREFFDLCPKCNHKLERWMNKHQQVIEVDDE